jgi:hypothetical protein
MTGWIINVKEKNMREKIIEMIQKSIGNIDSKYFKLETAYELNGIVRERVFCYELYHQIRKYQDNHDINTITLNGEIDKRGNQNFEKSDRKNPDFVFHIPGQMEWNTSVIEVKGKLDDIEGIIKDFNTLTLFVNKYNYLFGIFILYNHSVDDLKMILKRKQGEILCHDVFDKIDIISAVKADNKVTFMKTTLFDILK